MKKEIYIKIENCDKYEFILIRKFKNGDCFFKYPYGFAILDDDEEVINRVSFYGKEYGIEEPYLCFDYPECVTKEEKRYILKFFKEWEEEK